MEIKINIDPKNMTEDLSGILKSLNQEEKKEICRTLLMEWLKSPTDIEMGVKEEMVMKELRTDSYFRGDSDEQVRRSSKYQEKMKGFESTKAFMVRSITDEAKKHYSGMIVKKVRTDEQLQKLMNDELAKIKENFGKYVHDAMVAWFCTNMQRMTEGIATALMQTGQTNEAVQRLLQSSGRGY